MNTRILLILALISIYCPLWSSSAQKYRTTETEDGASPRKPKSAPLLPDDERETKKSATLIAPSSSFPGTHPRLIALEKQQKTVNKYTRASQLAAIRLTNQFTMTPRTFTLLQLPVQKMPIRQSSNPTPSSPKPAALPFSRPASREQEQKQPAAEPIIKISVQTTD